MRKFSWHIIAGLTLVGLSGLVYYTQILLFHDPKDTLFYLLQDIAFVPVQVLLVTLILSEMLKRREMASLHHKLNMVIGAFFSEVGGGLLTKLVAADRESGSLMEQMPTIHASSNKDFARARHYIGTHTYPITPDDALFEDLRTFLLQRRPFLLGLLENQNLLEHESFTDLLWAVFHLTEELERRTDISSLTPPDRNHIAGDTVRAYRALAAVWVDYAEHLRDQYPYLFSFTVRTNPFDPETSVNVQ